MTKISWTQEVWNPITGCSKVSAGCKNCYAERMAKRLKAMGRPEYQRAIDDKGRWTGLITYVSDKRLMQPLRWRKPRRVFVNSMSDLFHVGLPVGLLSEIFAVMALAKQHTFQVLTKRPEYMAPLLRSIEMRGSIWAHAKAIHENTGLGAFNENAWEWPLPNVWLGTSVENQRAADERIPHLIKTPAALRFLSCEPLLGSIDLGLLGTAPGIAPYTLVHNRLHWVIAGGESGPNYRPLDMAWARSLRDQCQEGGVPFFFKQDADYRNEQRPWIVEDDGSKTEWRQMPSNWRTSQMH